MYQAAPANNNRVNIPLANQQNFMDYINACPNNKPTCVYFPYVKETGDYSLRNFRVSEIKNRAPLQEVEQCLFDLERCGTVTRAKITC